MSSPFRSTSGFTARRRVRPVVERTTFVVVSLGAVRYAFPVHLVERVLKHTHASTPSILYANQTLVLRELAPLLSLNATKLPATPCSPAARVLVLRDPMHTDGLMAVSVDDVHEVHAVELALVSPVPDAHALVTADAPPSPAVRAVYTRHEHQVWVLDPARFAEEAA